MSDITAASVTKVQTVVTGNKRLAFGKVTLTSSYPTGGYTVKASYFGLGNIEFLIPIGAGNAVTNGYDLSWDDVNGKIQVLYPQGGSASGTNDGSGTATGGASTASAVNATKPDINTAKSTEVQSTADLHTIYSWVLVLGT